MSGKLLKCRAKSDDFARKLAPRFVLNDELYIIVNTPQFITTAENNLSSDNDNDKINDKTTISPLLTLPIEILGLIFEALDCAPSQVSLALSCKSMALVARELDLSLSSFSAKYAGFLPVNVFDVPGLMRLLRSWMPSHLRLCDHCLTARPRAQDYWLQVDCTSNGAGVWITKTGWAFSNASWHKQVHDICPACHVSCSLSDYVDCDGCRALGRLGDVDWSRVSDHWRRRSVQEQQADHWDLSA